MSVELLANERIVWQGQQWTVTTLGLQPHDRFEDYWIEADRLAETRPHSNGTRSDWLLHMASKEWCDLEDFIAAFCIAVAIHKTKLGNIDVVGSIEDARDLKGR